VRNNIKSKITTEIMLGSVKSISWLDNNIIKIEKEIIIPEIMV